MSWIFGKKKQKESPPSTPEEEPAPSQDEGFIFIEQRNQPNADNNTPSLYPNLNDMTSPYPSYPPMPVPVAVPKQSSQDSQTHDLTSIPFKFCRDLERTMNEDLMIDKMRLEEISSFMNRINRENYDYKFNLERSVINEINSQNEE